MDCDFNPKKHVIFLKEQDLFSNAFAGDEILLLLPMTGPPVCS